jgi:hypothetical protein
VTPHDLDDEFLVWPFRRQLVDETTLADERTVQLVRRAPVVRPVVPLSPPAPPRRRPLSPLRLAVPVGAAVFVIAAAATAAVGGADDSARAGAAPVAPAHAHVQVHAPAG